MTTTATKKKRKKHVYTFPQDVLGIGDITIPGHILFHPQLTMRERILYGLLLALEKRDPNGYIYEPNGSLATELGVHPQIITNSISKLRKLDLLEVAYWKGGRFYSYNEIRGGWTALRRIKLVR